MLILCLPLWLASPACQEQAEPSPSNLQSTESISETSASSSSPQEPQPAAKEILFATLAAARGLPPEVPVRAKHFRLDGKAHFRISQANGQEKSIFNDCSMSLAGPDRLRYHAGSGNKKNLFLLESHKQAWMLPAGKNQYEAIDATALAKENWLRWHMLRFPWDFQQAFTELSAWPPEGWIRETPFGPMTVELDQEQRPAKIIWGEWLILLDRYQQNPSGVWLATRWQWFQENGSRTETFHQIYDQAFFLPYAFQRRGLHPVPGSWVGVVEKPGEDARQTRETVEWVVMPALKVLIGPYPPEWKPNLEARVRPLPQTWQMHRQGRPLETAIPYAGVAKRLPEGIRAERLVEGPYLRFSVYGSIRVEECRRLLQQAAREADLETFGPLLFADVPAEDPRAQRLALIAVRKKGN
ncbi:MAG: hypothetical protein DWQ01_03820 [Planctomycetota bacterium]|nr:MAG: hypothetical protein DWQ01_03820 [Planctomycetota bacterium]